MKRIPVIMIFLSLVLYGKAENPPSDKDKAVACIKRWEGWHRGKMPYIGYGHRLLPHEKLTENLSEAQADSLLRCDLERCHCEGRQSCFCHLLSSTDGLLKPEQRPWNKTPCGSRYQ